MKARRRRAARPRGERTTFTSLALVLHSSEWSETSRVVQLLLPTAGRCTVLARGVERASSPWRGVFDLLCLVEVELEAEEGRELHALRRARLVEHYPRLRTELARWYRALYAAELVEAATPPGQPAPELFAAFCDALARWCDPHADPDEELIAFEWRYLEALGLSPALTACATCGRSVDPARAQTALFHPSAGGVQCSACRSQARLDLMPSRAGRPRTTWRRVPVATLFALERARREPLEARGEALVDRDRERAEETSALRRTARHLLDDFLAWQLERPSRVRPFLR
ncbi:MAG: DNA repair protein RecO [Planctomycetes bacterium]|nr:DNA repair protein RecO [Planctomycetota bacterium]